MKEVRDFRIESGAGENRETLAVTPKRSGTLTPFGVSSRNISPNEAVFPPTIGTSSITISPEPFNMVC